MSLLPGDIAALAAFFDPAALAAVVRDVFGAPPAASCSAKQEIISLPARVAAVHDREVLGRLLPREVYDYWRQADYAGIYAMTFMLRHGLTFLALAMHDRACSDSGAQHACEKYYASYGGSVVAECLEILSERPFPKQSFPLLGFSALGVHFSSRQNGFCRAFDAYAIGCCGEPAEGLFCRKHRREAWWWHEDRGGSTQADMFRFYAPAQNLYAYGEHELAAIVRGFWSRMENYRRSLQIAEPDVSEALSFFGYSSFTEVCFGGQATLRKRYAELARELHPDMGGEHLAFLTLKNHYELLRNRLSFVHARS